MLGLLPLPKLCVPENGRASLTVFQVVIRFAAQRVYKSKETLSTSEFRIDLLRRIREWSNLILTKNNMKKGNKDDFNNIKCGFVSG